MPRANAPVPATQYRRIDSGNQIMFAYLARLGMPREYPVIAAAPVARVRRHQ